MNTLKTAFLLTGLTLLLVLAGDYFGGQNGMILAFLFAAAMNFFSYFYSDKIALKMYSARPVTREELPRVYQVVERMTQRIGLPMPKIYVIPSDSPNAFATGRNPQHASVAVTNGILNLLNDDELEGVLAHELGHVKNRDILTSSIAATLAGAITILARMGYVGHAVWRLWRRWTRPRTRRRRNRRAIDADPGSDCGGTDSAVRYRVHANMRRMRRARISPGILMRWLPRSRSSTRIQSAFLCRLRRRMRTCLSWLR